MKDFRKSVVYQIYPKSFKDSNGDGIGDLPGVTAKLDYLKQLGVDYIWLNPFYVSPQKDNGYDVADYCAIDETFGTMADFEELVRAAKKLDIEIMLDMVFNHTSTEHRWFKQALAGDERYKNYYIFLEPKEGREPTNWQSKFGGPAWQYVKEHNAYYLHLFDITQADLNWKNETVRQEIFDIVRFWLAKGVKGFRLDVINLISKPDVYQDDNEGDGRRFYADGQQIHEYLKELNRETFGRYEDVITVGEMSSTSLDNCIRYSNPAEKELSMVFSFHHLKVDYKDGEKWALMDFDFRQLKQILNLWQVTMQEANGWNALFWCNHDQPRIVSRFGDDRLYRKESAKMLATTIHFMRGTPYISHGEEIGMTNPSFDAIAMYRAAECINRYALLKQEGWQDQAIIRVLQAKSRDNSRTPMQWNDSVQAGFTSGTPWINVNQNYTEINVKNDLQAKGSVFHYYRQLIKLRKEYDIIAYGEYKPILEEHEQIFAYLREYKSEKLLVINNFYGRETVFTLPGDIEISRYKSSILITNYGDAGRDCKKVVLRPYESIVYHLVK